MNQGCSPGPSDGGTARKNALTRMVMATRGRRRHTESDSLSLAKIRETLMRAPAIEKFEAPKDQNRFFKWLRASLSQAVRRRSRRPVSKVSFDAEQFLTTAPK
jgi:hypothetical protein